MEDADGGKEQDTPKNEAKQAITSSHAPIEP